MAGRVFSLESLPLRWRDNQETDAVFWNIAGVFQFLAVPHLKKIESTDRKQFIPWTLPG